MTQLEVLSYSNDLKEVLKNGKIHSIFERSINIQTIDNELYSLVTSDIFEGPRQIRLNRKRLDNLGFEKNHVVLINKTVNIVMNQIEMTLEGSQEFNVIKPVYPPKLPNDLLTQVTEVDQYLRSHLDTVGYYGKTYNSPMEEVIIRWLNDKSNTLVESLLEENPTAIASSLSSLVGLGHGLTPSGDDILTGLSLVINSQEFPSPIQQQLFNDCLSEAMNKTNFISQKQLELSMEGKSLFPVIKVISHFYRGDPFKIIIESLNQVISIGSSSGSDILAGIILGMLLIEKL